MTAIPSMRRVAVASCAAAAAGTVAAIATFPVAFLARSLGSVLFGRLGDRLGRKQTLIITLLLARPDTRYRSLRAPATRSVLVEG